LSSADSSDDESVVAYRIHAAQPIDRDQLRHRFASSEFDLVSKTRPHEQVYQHADVDYHRDPLTQKPIVPLDLKVPAPKAEAPKTATKSLYPERDPASKQATESKYAAP